MANGHRPLTIWNSSLNNIMENKQIPKLYTLHLASADGHEEELIVLLSRFGDLVNSCLQFTLASAEYKCENVRRTTFSLNDIGKKSTLVPFFSDLNLFI